MDGKLVNAVLWAGTSIVIHRMLCLRRSVRARRVAEAVTVSAPGKALIGN